MGVPVITLAGEHHLSRVGVSLLENAGFSELIATSVDDYVERAVALANDLARLAQLRDGLRERMQTSPLMREQEFTRELERAYRKMWTAHVRNSRFARYFLPMVDFDIRELLGELVTPIKIVDVGAMVHDECCSDLPAARQCKDRNDHRL
jgi:hypothetical protein